MSAVRLTPVVTEKSFAASERGIYAFKVAQNLTKPKIRQAVQERFGVTVTEIRTATVPGKTRTRGRVKGFRPGYKKAVVTLKKGDKIAGLEG